MFEFKVQFPLESHNLTGCGYLLKEEVETEKLKEILSITYFDC